MSTDMETKSQLARLSLAEEFTGNINDAKKMIAGSFLDIVVIRARFKETASQYYCNLSIFVNVYQHYILDTKVIIGTHASLFESSLSSEWITFTDRIVGDLKNGNEEKEMTIKAENLIYQAFNPTILEKIGAVYKQNNQTGIKKLIVHLMKPLMTVNEEDVSVTFDLTNSLKINEFYGSMPKNTGTDQSETEVSETVNAVHEVDLLKEMVDRGNMLESQYSGAILNTKAKVSPVKGILIDQLKIGDRINVLLFDHSELANQFIRQNNLINQGRTLPITGVIEHIIRRKEHLTIYLKPDNNEGILFKMMEHYGFKVDNLCDDLPKGLKDPVIRDLEQQKRIFVLLFAIGGPLVITLILIIILVNIL